MGGAEDGADGTAEDIQRELHVQFFLRFLQLVPAQYASLDTNRLMIVYMACSALDTLGALDAIPDRQEIVDWVYNNQVLTGPLNGDGAGGFVGGGFLGPMKSGEEATKYHCAHVSMTYCALLVLSILGDDFSRVDRDAVMRGIRAIQQDDGSFEAVSLGTESDMRFVFSAVATCFMLQDWRGIDVDKTVAFILRSRSFDGGFGILPDQEAHAGAIYCATAALGLLGHLDKLTDDRLVDFLAARQVGGFNGRINKVPDTCYTFWVGGSMQALGVHDQIDVASARKFILTCQSAIGGFSKVPGRLPSVYPDILHAHYSVLGLSLMREPGFQPIVAALGITRRCFLAAPFSQQAGGAKVSTGARYQLPK